MFTTHFFSFSMKKICLIFLTGVLTVFLVACGGESSPAPAGNNAVPTSSTVTAANAIMRHSPTGTVELTWDQADHALTVRLAMTGMAPKSQHPAAINSGSCKSPGKQLYPLSNVVADAIGFANVMTKVKDVPNGIPASGWYVDIRNGSGTDANSNLSIACADVFNSTSSVSSTATLNLTTAPNQSTSGLAELTVTNNRLIVTVTMRDMAANSRHAADIHLGSCVSQGKLVHTLNPVTVNAAGDGSSHTTIDNVSAIPRSGWYVTVHLGNQIDAKSPSTDVDLIACGDLTPRI